MLTAIAQRALRQGNAAVINVALLACIAASLVCLVGAPPAAAAAKPVTSVAAGQGLQLGTTLFSHDHRFRAQVTSGGNLVVTGPTGRVWSTRTRGASARLRVQSNGDVVLWSGSRALWRSGTYGSGGANVLWLGSDGVLRISNHAALVWASSSGNACGGNRSAHRIRIVLHRQLAWMCRYRQLIRTSFVTTGATAKGDGTPTGSWRIYAKTRDTHLRPAAGGVYFVHYWMPYSGAYGLHDSPWQRFAYGSARYRTQGSHGCIHLPGATMAWFYRWAPIGTGVTVSR
ncbi:L,D-transpeptidase family protein [uncultured Jatrophihabitans sp.]|uniref:L,D-transpeptidase family protein n=1 Tax=uncultured Jatrophihabitans sp. TaxID=1610747 RepID=UPI0035CA0A30